MKRALKPLGIVVALAAAAVGAFAAFVYLRSNALMARRFDVPTVAFAKDVKADAKRGERLAKVRLGCAECHGEDLGGGTLFENPAMGAIRGPNLTPANLEGWTDGEVARAIRHGLHKDGRPLVLMPSHDYQHVSQEDLASVVAYLRTLAPIERRVVPVEAGPVMRALIATGKAPTLLTADVIDHAAPLPSAVAEGPTKEFGLYLAKTTCMGCHGPELKGGPIPGGDPSWPPASALTPDALDGWTYEGFKKALTQGVNPSGTTLRPPMVVKYTRHFTETELRALWAYLSSLPKSESW